MNKPIITDIKLQMHRLNLNTFINQSNMSIFQLVYQVVDVIIKFSVKKHVLT